MEVLMVQRVFTFSILIASILGAYCKTYEDSFNRNLDSTGVYVPNSGSNTVSQLAADPKAGGLTDLGQLGVGNLPGFITVNAAGTFAYLVNTNDNLVQVYSISKTTRKLTLSSTASTGSTPIMIAFHGSGAFAYVVNANSKTISGYSVDATSGALTSLGAALTMGGTPIRIPNYIAITGNYAIVTASDYAELYLYDISPTTGALSANATPTATIGALPKWLILLASGNNPKLFVATAGNKIESMLFSSWSASPVTTQVSTGANPMVFSFNSSNTMAFVSNYDAASVSLYTVSGITLTPTATISTCTNPSQSLSNSAGFLYLICRADSKINAYTYTSNTLSAIGSVTVGTNPASITGY